MGLGGVETHVLSIIELFHKDYDFYIAAKDGKLKNKFKLYSKEILNLDFYNQSFESIFRNSDMLTEFIKKNKIDIIHIHQYLPYYPVLLSHYTTGVPYVITIHSFLFPEDNWKIAWGEDFVSFWNEIVFERLKRVAFVGYEHKEYWTKEFSVLKKKSCVMPNLININNFKYTPSNNFKCFMALRISADKKSQIDIAIKLIDSIRKINNKATLTVAGDGDLLSDYRTNTKNIKYIKFIGLRDNIEKIIMDYDIVFASGRTAIEAIASGKKVVLIGPFGLKGVINPKRFNNFSLVNFNGRNQEEVCEDDVAQEIGVISENEIRKNYEKLLKLLDTDKMKKIINGLYDSFNKESKNISAYIQLRNQIYISYMFRQKIEEFNAKFNNISESELSILYRKNKLFKVLILVTLIIAYFILIIFVYYANWLI